MPLAGLSSSLLQADHNVKSCLAASRTHIDGRLKANKALHKRTCPIYQVRAATPDQADAELNSDAGSSQATAAAQPTERSFKVQILNSIEAIDSEDWNATAIGSGEVNPFVLHGFLQSLETSSSAVKETGWAPHHLVVREEGSDAVVGCCPIYMKPHSYGEYIFDHSWASLAMRFGHRYYPKLQCCVPFSPRSGIQYHWENPGFSSFDDFLGTLKQPKRKNIRQERKAITTSGLKVRRLSGYDLKPTHWDQFFKFYMNTCDSKWGQAYLTQDFFQELGATMAEHVMLVVAQEGDESSPLVAGALNLIGSDAIYGRNWGCSRSCNVKHLHFELCYYQAQEEAIARGLKRVEAGAQGEHKIQRGYLPSKTYSSHYIRDPMLRSVLGRHLEHEQETIDQHLQWLREISSPFKDIS